MRALLGITILATLCWMAAAWQGRWTEGLREEREIVHGTEALALSSAGWSTLVIGRPSGAAPRPTLEDEDGGWATTPGTGQQAEAGFAFASIPATRHTVRAGDVLGKICQRHYGSDRPLFPKLADLVLAVAVHNGLPTPDAIREGQTIELPDLQVLAQPR